MKMNPEIKAKWVAALRSGEYKQTHYKLTDDNGNFCCLGVLCDLYAKERGVQRLYDLESHEQAEIPSATVLAWSGLSKDMTVSIEQVSAPLFGHNDGFAEHGPRTFAEIAKAIEEQL